MMTKILKIIMVIFLGINIVNCATVPQQNIVTHVDSSVLLGGQIGQVMDENDQLKTSQALENNPINQPSSWQNSKSNTYTVVPTKNITVANNKFCREYRVTLVANHDKQQIYGTACRQTDGSWKTAK